MLKRIFLGVILLLLTGTIVFATVGAAAGPTRVGALSGITGLAMVKLMAEPGNDRAAQYDIGVYKSPDLLAAKVVAGEEDIATLPINTAAILYNRGVPLQVVSVIGWGVLYIVSNEPALKGWAGLKGKEVYVPAKGTVPDLLLRYLATRNGLMPDRDFTLHYIASPVELAQLAATGKAGVAVLPEPWVTQVTMGNGRYRIALDLQKEWRKLERQSLTYPQSCVVVSKRRLANPMFLAQFRKDLAASIGWVNHQPQQAGVLAERLVQIPAAAVQIGIKRCNLKYVDAVKVKGEINRFLERLGEKTPEAIGGKVPDEGFYYQP